MFTPHDDTDLSPTESNDDEEATNTCSPSLSTSPDSGSPLSACSKTPALSIDCIICLRPIVDSPDCPVLEEAVIAKEDQQSSSAEHVKKRKRLNRKRSTSWSGLSRLLSLFVSGRTVKEKQMKVFFHKELVGILTGNDEASKYKSIIRNILVSPDKKLCDVTTAIFEAESQTESDEANIFDVWCIGLVMIFMVAGKQCIAEYLDEFANLENVHAFLCDLYMKRVMSTNLFDLLSFYMLIFDSEDMDIASRYSQICMHSWFRS